MEKYVTVKEKEKELEDLVFRSLFADYKGKYRWVYELPMLKSFFLLFEVWKVLGLSAMIVVFFMSVVSLVQGGGPSAMIFNMEMGALVFGIMFVLSIHCHQSQ